MTTQTNKSYLLMVDDKTAAKLAVLGLGLQFLETSGMSIDGKTDIQVLVTPAACTEKVVQMPEAETNV